ncbi:MAG: peptidoglycan-binding protein, partial [Chloroflexi bacterium]
INAAAETADGGLLLAGETWEKTSVYWLARLDSRGNLLWEKTLGYYGIPNAPGTEIEAILPLENGEILLGGNTDLVGNSITAASSAWLARIPDSGQVFGLLSLQPGKFTVISTLSSRPNTLPDEILTSVEIFYNEMEAQVTTTHLQPIPVCFPAEASFPTPAALPSLTPSITPTPSFTRDLYLTNPPLQGDDVLKLQQRLLELGYSEVGAPDGVFGKMTGSAVRRFQQNNGLEVDGYVGPKTWRKLFGADAVRSG